MLLENLKVLSMQSLKDKLPRQRALYQMIIAAIEAVAKKEQSDVTERMAIKQVEKQIELFLELSLASGGLDTEELDVFNNLQQLLPPLCNKIELIDALNAGQIKPEKPQLKYYIQAMSDWCYENEYRPDMAVVLDVAKQIIGR